ncbi:unnamed protein product [Schistosoma curassoni]|uniref:Uncharacterized protein n=1 Tax=Schistosoma curassoni TaxID=6186 RepID=A0A183KCP4_9TREM|nr:unnamed protein product [Schistosoma curassoni]
MKQYVGLQLEIVCLIKLMMHSVYSVEIFYHLVYKQVDQRLNSLQPRFLHKEIVFEIDLMHNQQHHCKGQAYRVDIPYNQDVHFLEYDR